METIKNCDRYIQLNIILLILYGLLNGCSPTEYTIPADYKVALEENKKIPLRSGLYIHLYLRNIKIFPKMETDIRAGSVIKIGEIIQKVYKETLSQVFQDVVIIEDMDQKVKMKGYDCLVILEPPDLEDLERRFKKLTETTKTDMDILAFEPGIVSINFYKPGVLVYHTRAEVNLTWVIKDLQGNILFKKTIKGESDVKKGPPLEVCKLAIQDHFKKAHRSITTTAWRKQLQTSNK
jgi:hypothetical protein